MLKKYQFYPYYPDKKTFVYLTKLKLFNMAAFMADFRLSLSFLTVLLQVFYIMINSYFCLYYFLNLLNYLKD